MSNTDDELDEILGIELKDKGTKVLKLIDVNQVKQAIKAYTDRARIDEVDNFPTTKYTPEDDYKHERLTQLKGDK